MTNLRNRAVNRRLLLPSLCAVLLLACTLAPAGGFSQDRNPAVAGQFYPADSATLAGTLNELFARADPSPGPGKVLAILVPHAGYVFSGEVAASGYRQIDPSMTYEHVFVLGPSHHVGFEGASVFTAGNYRTPLGTVEVDRALGRQLCEASQLFNERRDIHESEHSIEVQLPFLQYYIKTPLRIVPIVLGTPSGQTSREIAEVLRPYFTERNLFVISTDFSHYPKYEDAVRVDSVSAHAILENSPGAFMRAMISNRRSGTPNLLTSMCGESCALTLLNITSQDPAIRYTEIQYRNSGDVSHGQRDRVVGYCAITVTKGGRPQGEAFELKPGERSALLNIARETVEHVVRDGTLPVLEPEGLPATLTRCCGAFVTLDRDKTLRGCIGRSGTLLPQVALQTGWTREELLGHCARDKAGIAWDGWKDAELSVYEAIVFGEEM